MPRQADRPTREGRFTPRRRRHSSPGRGRQDGGHGIHATGMLDPGQVQEGQADHPVQRDPRRGSIRDSRVIPGRPPHCRDRPRGGEHGQHAALLLEDQLQGQGRTGVLHSREVRTQHHLLQDEGRRQPAGRRDERDGLLLHHPPRRDEAEATRPVDAQVQRGSGQGPDSHRRRI